jgi:hypothetical protein
MTPTERVSYDAMVARGNDTSLSDKKRIMYKNNAASKLKKVIEERMPATELATLKSVKQVAVEHRQQQILYGVSLLNKEQKLMYDTNIAEAKHPATTKAKKKICNKRAVGIADYAANKHAEIEKKAAMTPEELQEYMESDGVVAKREKDAAIDKKKRDKRAAVDVLRHLGMTTAEVEAEKEKKNTHNASIKAKNLRKQKDLRDSGDELAISRNVKKNEKRTAKKHLERAEHHAEIAELFRNAGKIWRGRRA